MKEKLEVMPEYSKIRQIVEAVEEKDETILLSAALNNLEIE